MSGETATLRTLADNGMRVVEMPVAGRLATSISIAFAAGSRHDRPGEVGAAHLLEHMAFKGTQSLPSARELNRSAERLGTELDELLLAIPARPVAEPPSPLWAFAPTIELEPREGDVAHPRIAYDVPGLDLTDARRRAVAEVFSQVLGGPTEEEAQRMRAYAVGMFALSFDSIGARAGHALETLMEYGDERIEPLAYLRAIESVTRDDLAELAAQIAPQPCIGCAGDVDVRAFEGA